MSNVPRLTARKRVVPDLVGLDIDNAQVVLHNAGFPPGQVHFSESYEPENSVVSQEPSRGQMVDGDTVIRLHVAKPNLARHLPSIYQMTGLGVESEFLRRYLWIFHHLFESLTRKIDRIDKTFRPLEVQEELLPWLASWLALTLDPDWPVERKRKLIRRAAELYAIRGTSRAVAQFLEIFTGVEPEIEENKWPHKGFRVGISSVIGVDSIILPPMNLSHCFIVRLPFAYEEVSDDMIVKIHRIIQNEKPGHSVYYLQFKDKEKVTDLGGFMQIGVASVIGESEDEGGSATE